MNAKKSIIIAAVVAAATSFGVYAGGAYAQSAYAGNDDPAVNADPTATEAPAVEVAGCWFWEDCKSGNEAVIDIDGAESEIAEGGPGAWICSVAGCNEDGSVIDPINDGGAIVE